MVAISGLLTPSTYAVTECDITVTSVPSGADVYLDEVLVGKTPYLHFVGQPFEIDVRVEMEGFETWTKHVVVGEREHVVANAVLVPLQAGAVTVTTTVTTTITTTSISTTTSTTTTTATIPTTITATTTSITTSTTTTTATIPTTITATTTVSENTVTVTSEVTTATTSTVTNEVTEQTGLPATISYGAIGVGVLAVMAAAIIVTRKRS